MGFIFRSSTHNYACVAQLVEQLTLNQWVRGSNPRARTNKIMPPLRRLYCIDKHDQLRSGSQALPE